MLQINYFTLMKHNCMQLQNETIQCICFNDQHEVHQMITSNETDGHPGPKRKLWAGYTVPSRKRRAMCHQSYFSPLDVVDCNARHIFHRRVWYRTLSLSYVCIRRLGIILIP